MSKSGFAAFRERTRERHDCTLLAGTRNPCPTLSESIGNSERLAAPFFAGMLSGVKIAYGVVFSVICFCLSARLTGVFVFGQDSATCFVSDKVEYMGSRVRVKLFSQQTSGSLTSGVKKYFWQRPLNASSWRSISARHFSGTRITKGEPEIADSIRVLQMPSP